jgi:hypothetical protein
VVASSFAPMIVKSGVDVVNVTLPVKPDVAAKKSV